MSEIIKKAREKLTKELKNFTGGNKEKAVSSYVEKTLKEFCKEEAFADAVVNSKKTLSDCCKAIMAKCGNHISDLEVYKKAAQFYFPGAKVNFTMSIETGKSAVEVSDEVTDQVSNGAAGAAGTALDKANNKVNKPKQKKNNEESNESDPLAGTIQISLFGV